MSQALVTTQAWSALAERIERAGRDLANHPFPTGPRETAEGYRYLSRLVVLGLQWAIEFADPDFPAFYRHDDDITKWGGPNVDNRYLRARVRGDAAYRLTGNVSSSHGCVISELEGDMQLEEYGVYEEVWHDQLVTDADGNFELLLSAERDARAQNWMYLHPKTGNITIREYFDDWPRHMPGEFFIERVDGPSVQAPVTAAQMAARLDEAGRWIETSLHYWNRYLVDKRAQSAANVVQAAGGELGGAKDIAYGFVFTDLEPDEALVIEGEPPDAWFWNYLLYNDGWFESLETANRATSRTGHMMRVDPDGRFRLVIAHQDPGVENWLDTTGLRKTVVAYRYVRTTTSPVPTTRVVPFTKLQTALHPETPTFSNDARHNEIAMRRRHIARRFRR